jgi:hypothetical protein
VCIKLAFSGQLVGDPVLPRIVSKRGCDLLPVREAMRLRAFVFEDEPERLALLDAAIAVLESESVIVDKESAVTWLARQLEGEEREEEEGKDMKTLTVVWTSMTLQYMQQREVKQLFDLVTCASRPVVWLRLEQADVIKQHDFSGAYVLEAVSSKRSVVLATYDGEKLTSLL